MPISKARLGVAGSAAWDASAVDNIAAKAIRVLIACPLLARWLRTVSLKTRKREVRSDAAETRQVVARRGSALLRTNGSRHAAGSAVSPVGDAERAPGRRGIRSWT